MKRRLLALCVLLPVLARAEENAAGAAIARALPWLEEEGTWWIEEKNCVSCHHTTFLIWTKELARRAGYPVDEAILGQQQEWVLKQFLTPRKPNPDNPKDTVKEGEVNGDRNVEGVAQFLVSPAASRLDEGGRAGLEDLVLRNRNPSGGWSPGGQLPSQKRPKAETAAISGLWAQLATGHGQPTPAPETTRTTEWFALDALLDPGEKALSTLLDRQNDDGGWSWIDGEPSGPTGTGQALLALGRLAGSIEEGLEPRATSAAQRARQWLVGHQSEDGRWKTMSTKNRGKSTRISDFWGTSWAVIGLLESEVAPSR